MPRARTRPDPIPPRIDVQPSGDVLCLVVRGAELTGDEWVQCLRRTAETATAEVDRPKVLLDLHDVEHMSSAVLGELVNINRAMFKRGGELRLCGLKPSLKDVLAVSGLDRALHIDADREQSMRRLG